MRIPVLALALCAPLPAAAQSLSGPAHVIDGDTLEMAGERIRLFGIDAPESMQTCQRKGAPWACGTGAKLLLAGMIEGRSVDCLPRDRDSYGRTVATCRVGERDLAGVLVREGMAVALRSFSLDYVDAEARAKSFGLALWGSVFQAPADFRAANPALFKAPPPPPAIWIASRSAAPPGVEAMALGRVMYRNCTEARAAGAAPLHRGQPGYRPQMDGDNDGVACEPYRR